MLGDFSSHVTSLQKSLIFVPNVFFLKTQLHMPRADFILREVGSLTQIQLTLQCGLDPKDLSLPGSSDGTYSEFFLNK